jgi:uncharacterized repeat protein (TIGR01451 family)
MLQSPDRKRRSHRQPARKPRLPRLERLEERQLLATFPVTNPAGTAALGTLIDAINKSNATDPGPGGHNTITFALGTGGFQKIALAQALPAITKPVWIDGTTQGPYSGTPNIEIDGTTPGGTAFTIDPTAAGSQITALAIDNFGGTSAAIQVNADNTWIRANYIGITPSGAPAGVGSGVVIGGIGMNPGPTGVTVGGTTAGDGNVISAYNFDGVSVTNGSQELIAGNFLGTDKTGSFNVSGPLPPFDGIVLNGSSNNSITGNVISQFSFEGIQLTGNSTQNLINGNNIGTDVTGSVALNLNIINDLAKPLDIAASATDNTIGGVTPADRNVISGNAAAGPAVLLQAPNTLFEGNYVGIGLNDKSLINRGLGVLISANDVTLGGTTPGAGNVISGNAGDGVSVAGTVGSGVQILGNLIGLDIFGDSAVPNGNPSTPAGAGIHVDGAAGVMIGGSAPGAGNFISGNVAAGVEVSSGSGGVTLFGNYIGTDTSGLNPVGNAVGILIDGGSGVIVGGASPGEGNVISGNAAVNGFLGNGIEVDTSAGGNLFLGNFVGTDPTGTLPVPNAGSGFSFQGSTNDTVGGTAQGDANVISGNFGNGIITGGTATGLRVLGNLIGTDATGLLDVGNLGDGVRLGTSNNSVGGTAQGARNIIAFNGIGTTGDGIHVVKVGAAPVGNVFQHNSIFNNNALGISLTNGGIIPLPIATPSGGANATQNNHINYPILTQALVNNSSGNLAVTGLLTKMRANTTYLIEYYQSATADASGSGEGETLIGVDQVTTDNSGNATITSVLTSPLIQPGDVISATATDAPLQDGSSEFAAAIPIQAIVDLSLQVTSNPPAVYVGQTATFTVTVTNNGTDDAHNVTITDTLPAGLALVNATDDVGGTIVISGTTITDSIGVIPAGATATLTIDVVPSQANVPSMTDSAVVATTDQNTSGTTTGSASVVVNPVVPVSISVVASPDPATVGQGLTYVVTLQNLNPVSAATGVVFTDTLDPNVLFDPAGSSLGLTLSGTTLTDDVGTIAGGKTVTLTIHVIPQATAVDPLTDTGTLINSAVETYDQLASDPTGTHSVTTTTAVNPSADVSVAFSPAPGPNPVPVNQQLTYTIVVTNNGPSTANDIVLTDVLDPNVTFVPGASTPGLVASGQTLTATIGQLASGNSTVFTVVVTPSTAAINPVTNTGSVTNAASVSAAEGDPVTGNNTATVSVGVSPVATLTIAGSATPDPVSAGGNLVYTFTVTNTGPSTANNVVFTDPIPLNETYVSASATQGLPPSSLNNTITANLGTLAPNASAVVTVTLQPTGKAGNVGSVTNTASVTANESPAGSSPAATVVTNVTPSADLAVTVTASPSPVLVQTGLAYVITATNNGPSDATDVVVTDTLAASVIAGTIVTSQGTFTLSGQTVTADFGKIPAGGSATLTVNVTPQTAGSVDNSATVTNTVAAETDPNPANNSFGLATQVTPQADLRVELVGTPNPLFSGTDELYTATAFNQGPSDATNVTITNTVPTGAQVVSVITSAGGSFTISGGVITATFPSLAAGASASMTVDVILSTRGQVIDTAAVAGTELDSNTDNNTATVTTSVQDLPGTFDFLNPTYTVDNNAGVATITVIRTGGLQGDVQVQYATGGGTAKPGLDYTPTSGTLDFPDGVSTQSFTIPVLPYAFNRGDVTLGVALSNPAGGAVLGPQTGAQLTIHVLNPDTTAPTVTGVSWFGVGQRASDIVVAFSKPLDASTASNPDNYQLVNTGRDSVFGTRDDSRVTIASATYNPADNTVVLVPSAPLRANTFYHLAINGSQGSPITDIVGNVLAGNGSAQGTDDVLYFASGGNLTYVDGGGNQVSFRIAGGGALNLTRFANGNGNNLQIVNEVPHRTRVQGRVRRVGRVGGSGVTSLSSITGLGNFGDVRVQMSTPPFFVAQPSFAASGPSASAATTHAVATHVAHPHAVAAHALHAHRGGAFARRHR